MKPGTGQEGLIGTEGIVLACNAGKVTVRVHGEIWQVKAAQPTAAGQRIRVTQVSGLELTIEPLDQNDL